jgi:hypothetical protein
MDRNGGPLFPGGIARSDRIPPSHMDEDVGRYADRRHSKEKIHTFADRKFDKLNSFEPARLGNAIFHRFSTYLSAQSAVILHYQETFPSGLQQSLFSTMKQGHSTFFLTET